MTDEQIVALYWSRSEDAIAQSAAGVLRCVSWGTRVRRRSA